MKLILVRHGIAIDREDFQSSSKSLGVKDDSQRPLTDKGRQKSEVMAKLLKKSFPDDYTIVSSPYLRARQTAQIFHAVHGGKKLAEVVELVPAAPPEAFAEWIRRELRLSRAAIAVGHEPMLGVFASWCLSGVHHSFIEFKKSGMLCLEVENFSELTSRRAELKWSFSPKLIEDSV